MRALPLWQPWATLCAFGKKTIETRHWAAPATIVGQRIAIYATKTGPGTNVVAAAYPGREHFAAALDELDRDGAPWRDPITGDVPVGQLVGTVLLARCRQMTDDLVERLAQRNPREHAFGLYEAGRYAWVLEQPRPLARPIAPPDTGSRQGIFIVPDEYVDGEGPPQGNLW